MSEPERGDRTERARIERAADIEPASMRVVDELLPDGGWSAEERAIVKRLVHASGDPSLASAIAFSPGAVAAGVAALRRGGDVVTDVRMVAVGVDQRRLGALGGTLRCAIDDDEVARQAAESGRTRAATAMRSLPDVLPGSIVAIGNAPTALREIIALTEAGVRPALVVGVPVGFIDAAESKAALEATDLPYVTIRGTRGGSPLAAAAVNALLRLAESDA